MQTIENNAMMCAPQVVFFIVIEFSLLWFATELDACSCPLHDVKIGYERADVIIHGEVIRKMPGFVEYLSPNYKFDEDGDYTETGDSSLERMYFQIVEVQVVKKIKSFDVFDRVEIITHSFESACGYPFEVGEEYLIYANKKSLEFSVRYAHSNLPVGSLPGRHFTTSLCTRTTASVQYELDAIEDYQLNNRY